MLGLKQFYKMNLDFLDALVTHDIICLYRILVSLHNIAWIK